MAAGRCALLTLFLASSLAGCSIPSSSADGEVMVFAAASLSNAFDAARMPFNKAHPGWSLRFQFAGSQQLRMQLEEGARADVFASADPVEMQALVDGGLVDSSQVRTLASNSLVVILAQGNPAGLTDLADLARPGVRLALADRSVPIGRYTQAFLEEFAAARGLDAAFIDRVWARAVSLEQSVSGVATKVLTGEVDAGVVYRTDAVSGVAAGLDVLDVPEASNPPIVYDVAPLATAEDPKGAEAFIGWITSDDGQRVLAGLGFRPRP